MSNSGIPQKSGGEGSQAVPDFEARCVPDFKNYLEALNLKELDNYPDTVYAICPELKITYVNKGWYNFAEKNNGGLLPKLEKPLGHQILEAFPSALKGFYEELFLKALNRKKESDLAPLQHAYECSSPEHFRQFSMALYPLDQKKGLVIVNSLVVVQAHADSHAPIVATYRDLDGIIHQCAHCRKVRRNKNAQAWDLVPEWIKQMPQNVSHDLCTACFGHYYPAR